MKTWLLIRKLSTAGGDTSWVCGAVESEAEAKAQVDLLNVDLRDVMSAQIVDREGTQHGTVRDLLVAIGVTGVSHARVAVEPRSAILTPEKGIIVQ